jgi:hypothetical protein
MTTLEEESLLNPIEEQEHEEEADEEIHQAHEDHVYKEIHHSIHEVFDEDCKDKTPLESIEEEPRDEE